MTEDACEPDGRGAWDSPNPARRGTALRRLTLPLLAVLSWVSAPDAAAQPDQLTADRQAVRATAAALSRNPSLSLDCAKAFALVEKSICADPELVGVDRALADAYAKAMRR